MVVSVKTMRRFTGTAGFLSFVCFCLDCYRVNQVQGSSGYFAAVFVADIWGFIPYTLLTLGKKNYGGSGAIPVPQKRTEKIFWRLVFLIIALIAPCIELANAGSLNSVFKNKNMSSESMDGMRKIIAVRMSDDPIAACWGTMGDLLRQAAKYTADGDVVLAACGALQARTVIMLIVSLLVLIETILYARSNVGTEAWVQEQLEKADSTTTAGPAETIEMAPPVYPVVYTVPTHTSPAPYTTTSPHSPPTVVDHQTLDLEKGVVQAV